MPHLHPAPTRRRCTAPAAKRFRHITDAVARKRLLTAYAPQDAAALAPFDPDSDGCIRFISRQEAVERGLKWYASERLCPFSKNYQTQDGRLVCLRRTASGSSFGDDRARCSTTIPN